jgi:hypothetical protein
MRCYFVREIASWSARHGFDAVIPRGYQPRQVVDEFRVWASKSGGEGGMSRRRRSLLRSRLPVFAGGAAIAALDRGGGNGRTVHADGNDELAERVALGDAVHEVDVVTSVPARLIRVETS